MLIQDITMAPGARLRVAAALAVVAAICGCVDGNNDSVFQSARADAPVRQASPHPVLPERDPEYFPHRFPAIQGEIEPLPPQF